ncbi:MAG: DUF4236 domain-containing protein [Alphaproteobacteria bacterium]|nr:DUF4236 domain-containing protein [Alphaproteobacteria bacterium]
MGIRFHKSIKLLSGLRLNLSKSGPSLSVGGKGLTYNIGSKGSRTTVGLPGSGVSYTTTRSNGNKSQAPILWIVLVICYAIYEYLTKQTQ